MLRITDPWWHIMATKYFLIRFFRSIEENNDNNSTFMQCMNPWKNYCHIFIHIWIYNSFTCNIACSWIFALIATFGIISFKRFDNKFVTMFSYNSTYIKLTMTTLLVYTIQAAGINKFNGEKNTNWRDFKEKRNRRHTHKRREGETFLTEMIGPVQWNWSDIVQLLWLWSGCHRNWGPLFYFPIKLPIAICCFCPFFNTHYNWNLTCHMQIFQLFFKSKY